MSRSSHIYLRLLPKCSEWLKRQLLFPALILLLAALVRVAFLDIKPPHFDEGINGWFCDQMAKTGYYAYDPTNYHGPLHFYVLFVLFSYSAATFGLCGLPVVLASLLTIFLDLPFQTILRPNDLLSGCVRDGDFSRVYLL